MAGAALACRFASSNSTDATDCNGACMLTCIFLSDILTRCTPFSCSSCAPHPSSTGRTRPSDRDSTPSPASPSSDLASAPTDSERRITVSTAFCCSAIWVSRSLIRAAVPDAPASRALARNDSVKTLSRPAIKLEALDFLAVASAASPSPSPSVPPATSTGITSGLLPSGVTMTGVWFPDVTSDTKRTAASHIASACPWSSCVPAVPGGTPAIRIIPSAYFLGSPSVRPSHLAAAISAPGREAKSCLPMFSTSTALSDGAGGGAYLAPTLSVRCLTSTECIRASIFMSASHSMTLPSPKSSATRTNSLPNPSNSRYAMRSAPICLICRNLMRRRVLRRRLCMRFSSIWPSLVDVSHMPKVETIRNRSSFEVWRSLNSRLSLVTP